MSPCLLTLCLLLAHGSVALLSVSSVRYVAVANFDEGSVEDATILARPLVTEGPKAEAIPLCAAFCKVHFGCTAFRRVTGECLLLDADRLVTSGEEGGIRAFVQHLESNLESVAHVSPELEEEATMVVGLPPPAPATTTTTTTQRPRACAQEWVFNRDGTGGDNTNEGYHLEDDCLQLCRDKGANGASILDVENVELTNTKSCYCEFDMTGMTFYLGWKATFIVDC